MSEEWTAIDEVMSQLTSDDAHQVWLAAHAVLATWDRDILRQVAAGRAQIEAATDGLDMGGAFRSNRVYLVAALERADFAAHPGCLCCLYPNHDFYAPEREAERGHVTIEATQVDREAYETRYEVSCCDCRARFGATEQNGWHIPLYRWDIIP